MRLRDFLDSRPADVSTAGYSDPFAEFRVEDSRQVVLLMRQLRDGGAPLSLSSPSGATINASLWSLDVERGHMSLDIELADPALQPLIADPEVTAVAYLESVKLQFDLDGLVLVRGAQTTVLQANLPRRLWRFQRRGSYRVRPIDVRTPSAALRHPSIPDMLLTLRVLDVSVGGCALLMTADIPPLGIGNTLQGVVLTLDSFTRLEISMRLQHATSVGCEPGGLRLGCEMLCMTPEQQRLLQRFIDHTQRRRRQLSME